MIINIPRKIAKHMTTKKTGLEILKTGRFKISKTGWLGPGLYAHTGNGTEGKGDFTVCFDYSNLKLCGSDKPIELSDVQWNKLRKGSARAINCALAKIGYDGYLVDHSQWILIFPQSIVKIKPYVN